MITRLVALVLMVMMVLASVEAVAQQERFSPPEDVYIEVSKSEKGLVVSKTELSLKKGEYYRLNLICKDIAEETELSFDLDRLVTNSHVRVLTVEGIQVYLQGRHFRSVQCEGPGSVKFSFYPMRNGNYEVEIEEEDSENTASLSIVVE